MGAGHLWIEMPTTTLPSRNYPAGERVFAAPLTTGRRFSLVDVRFTYESWPNIPNLLEIIIERTEDGTTWLFVGGGIISGEPMDHKGVSLLTRYLRFSSRNGVTGAPVNIPGDLQVRATIAQSFKTAVTLRVEEN